MIKTLKTLFIFVSIMLCYAAEGQSRGGATTIDLDSSGGILIGHLSPSPQGHLKVNVQRYTTDGKIDPSFGINGSANIETGTAQAIQSLIVYDDDSISCAGALDQAETTMYFVARFLSGGLTDPSFGNSGVITILDQIYSFGNGHALFNTGALIAIAGQVINTNAILGGISTLSSTGVTGVNAQLDLPGDTTITDIAQSALGPNKAVVVGFSNAANLPRGFVGQYNVSLTGIDLDETFSNSGIVLTTPASDAVRYWQLCIDPDDNIVVVGQRNNTQVIERYTPTGAVDTSFGVAGSFAVPADLNAVLATLACQDDGNIVAGGYNTTEGIRELIVLRALSGGQGLDTSFGNLSGAFVLLNEDVTSQANDLVINASGCIFAAGSYDNDVLVLKLGPDGMPLIDFGENGAVARLLSNDATVTILRDQQPSGTDGGAFPALGTVTRTLNTLVGNSTDVSLSANQFTIQPGSYLILASAPGGGIGSHKISLFDVTHSSIITVGTSQPGLLSQSRSELRHVLHVTTETTFEIQHTGGAINLLITALGAAAGLVGLDEIYTEVTIIRL